MKNVLNFFFSFDKLLKEKLIIPFFWLAIISWGLAFFSTALDSISLGWLAALVDFFRFFVTVALAGGGSLPTRQRIHTLGDRKNQVIF